MEIAQSSPAKSRRLDIRSVPRRGMRFLLRWLIKLVVVAIMYVWRRKLVAAPIVLAFALAFWWFGADGARTWSTPSEAPSPPLEMFSTRVGALAPAPAAEQYLRAQSRYDAGSMWDTLSDGMKGSSARGGGMTQQRLTQQVDEARGNDVHFDEARYIGGYSAPDGNSFYLYVVTLSSGADSKYVPYTFTIGKEGKIQSID